MQPWCPILGLEHDILEVDDPFGVLSDVHVLARVVEQAELLQLFIVKLDQLHLVWDAQEFLQHV
jgi:hypothetical protein